MKQPTLFLLGISLYCFIAAFQPLHAQSLPVGMQYLEDAIRVQQINQGILPEYSFTIRPLNHIHFRQDSSYKKDHYRQSKPVFIALPFSQLHQYNSKLPFGWNDGPMIPAKGYQLLLSGGYYFSYGFIEAQLKPELVLASNPNFPVFTSYTRTAAELQSFYAFQNSIDLPSKFGPGHYSKLLAGQSYIRLHFNKLAFGISKENLWWGPGIRNSLIMSNNTAGIPHIFIQTNSPVKTAIGSFESILISGWLKSSGFYGFDTSFEINNQKLFKTKEKDTRYINGYAFCYQPKWLSGLFLGTNRMFYNNHLTNNYSFFENYLPVLSPFYAKNSNIAKDSLNIGQMSSIYFRLVAPKGKVEVYAEFGRNSYAYNTRDLLLQPDHSGAYLFGIKKIFETSKRKSQIELLLEITRMEKSKSSFIRTTPSWYTSLISADQFGYTQMGKVIGAGIGPGGDAQTFRFTVLRKNRNYGYMIERIVNNNDYYYATYIDDPRKVSADLSATIFYNQQWKQYLFSAKLNCTRYYNYQWYFLYDNPNSSAYWNYTGNNINNIQVQLGITYLFKQK